MQARGSIFNATFSDRKSPIAYGYDETMPIYFSQAPLFQVASGSSRRRWRWRRWWGQVAQAVRPSGRGTLNRSGHHSGNAAGGAAPVTLARVAPVKNSSPRSNDFSSGLSIRRWPSGRASCSDSASDEKNLLISGMLAGGSELANAPAVIDVPVGSGHVIMFANNPMWRHQTQGSFFLIFNAALNFDSLNTERAVPAPRPRAAATPTDDAQE